MMDARSLQSPYEDSGVILNQLGPPPADALGNSRPLRSTSLTSRPRRMKLVGYVVLLLVVAGGGFYLYDDGQRAKEETEKLQSALEAANARVARADNEAMSASASLARSENELAKSAASLAAAKEAAREKEEEATALESKLQSLLEDGQGQVLKGADGRLTLQLVDKVLFKSGKAELTKRGQRVMARVGVALKELEDKQVWVQGHTDAVPIQKANEAFKSNWELSATRALTVVHFLEDESGVDPKRLAAAAFGSHRPVSRHKKSKNRRIEIVLFPREVELKRSSNRSPTRAN